MTTTATPTATKVIFETERCDRCSGSGTYPSPCWNGVCLGCGGKGKRLTRAGRAAKKAWDTWTEEHTTIPVTDLVVGQIFVDRQGKKRTVSSITPDAHNEGHLMVKTPAMNFLMSGTATVRRLATPEEAAARRTRVLRLKGATEVPA